MECTNCRHFNPPRATVCELCRRPLVAAATSTPAPPFKKDTRLASSPSPTDGGGALRAAGQCTKCGRQNPPQAERCKDCDTPLVSPRLKLKPRTAGGGFELRSRHTTTYLICPPLPPLQLEEGSRYSIGRSDTSDILLPGEMVSRNHAALVWKDGVWLIEDFNSSNGTFHNGERVKGSHELNDGDTVTIGGFHMAIQVRRRPLEEKEEKAAIQQITQASTVSIDPRDLAPQPAERSEKSGLAGRLEDAAVPDIVSILNVNRRTGRLHVRSQDVGIGQIDLIDGEIVAAMIAVDPPQRGKAALFVISLARSGEFEFLHMQPEGEREIKEPTHVLAQKMSRLLRESQDGA